MPWGMRIRDAAGNVILDTGDRLTRYVGQFSVTTANTGSFTVPAMVGGAGWFHANGAFRSPVVTFNPSTGTFSWDWGSTPTSYRAAKTFRYGLY